MGVIVVALGVCQLSVVAKTSPKGGGGRVKPVFVVRDGTFSIDLYTLFCTLYNFSNSYSKFYYLCHIQNYNVHYQ